MAAVASLEDLKACEADIEKWSKEDREKFALLLNNHRKIGYKNICRMVMGTTAVELKE